MSSTSSNNNKNQSTNGKASRHYNHITTMFIPSSQASTPFALKFSYNDGFPEATFQSRLQEVLQTDEAPMKTSCTLGRLYTLPPHEDDVEYSTNVIATRIKGKFCSRMPETHCETKGPALLVGENEDGEVISLSKSSIINVDRVYEQLYGIPLHGRKRVKNDAPKKPQSAAKFYQKDLFNRLKEEGEHVLYPTLTGRAKQELENMTDDEKRPYLEMAREDKERYHREYQLYLKDNPKKPKGPRNAYNFYKQHCKTSMGDENEEKHPAWRDLTAEQKQPFEQKASDDKIRFEREVQALKEHCKQHGKPYDLIMNKKKRKRISSNSSSSGDTVKKPKKKRTKLS